MGGERSWHARKASGEGEFNRRRKHSGEGFRWRKGVSVFVDRVSKKIHRVTLKEAFSVYGNVTDVYIAYNNPGRINKAYTFAFIRFLTLEEAHRAVERGHNRRMDGFAIRVFMGKEQQSKASAKEDTKCWKGSNSILEDILEVKMKSNKSIKKSRLYMVTNGRSYKEVLVSKDKSNFGGSVERQGLVEGTNQVWMILENVPLVAWNESVFAAMANRWGSFISLEEDTSKRIRLDQAHILLGRCWIDEMGTQENGGAMARNQGTGEEISKFEVLDSDIKAAELQVPNSFDNLSNVKLANTESGRRIQKSIPSVVDNSEAGLIQNGQSHVVLGGSEGLVEIPIGQQSDSSKYSTESSEVQAPLLDKETGLFKVRPKYLRSCRNISAHSLRSKVDKIQLWATPYVAPIPSKQKRSKSNSSKTRSLCEKHDSSFSRSHQVEEGEEIQAIVETSKALEIRFKGGEEAVSKRLRELDESKNKE
ncbi:hypothetical protein V6N13_110982 [Hibiscus sabdariffa]